MTIYVNQKADAWGDGSKGRPFRTIQAAADLAEPGDEVLVSPGIYREYVRPRRGGLKEKRIAYRSAEPKKAVITGAEELTGWESLGDGVWRAEVDNAIFGDFHPYRELVSGDWFMGGFIAHRGDVYLNHKSLYEVQSLDEVRHPKVSPASWDPEGSLYKWYSEVGQEKTVFYCNFRDQDPNRNEVEISVRPACFAPEITGLDYISLSGFTVREAATQWAPPTAYQEGMIAPHWSKGWIIEDCDIYESKCSGISLGKYQQEGNDNKWLKWKYKDGTQTQRECVCQAQAEGWSRDRVGSHIIRRCEIHDCGQTGIVGHMGGAFSIIEDCHIHHINNKQNLAGAEIGGIKMHAAIDCIYRRNHIHHCTRGIWLDWQAQGTRVTQNVFHDNTLAGFYEDPCAEKGLTEEEKKEALAKRRAIFAGMGEDLFVEISHGPTLIDNNLLLSDRSLKLACQGVAVCHNLIAGSLVSIGIGTDNGAKTLPSPRFTPYHFPHRTEIFGFMTCLHGDDRFYDNIFVQKPVRPIMAAYREMQLAAEDGWDDGNIAVGTFPFDGYPDLDSWKKEFDEYCGMGSAPSDRYYSPLPVWAEGNVYLAGARAWEKEKKNLILPDETIRVETDDRLDHDLRDPAEDENAGERDGLKAGQAEEAAADPNVSPVDEALKEIHLQIPAEIKDRILAWAGEEKFPMIDTDKLGMAFEPEEKYEAPDGSPLTLDQDLRMEKRSQPVLPGPFNRLG
ncbi:MAG: right-handed parallel beta-helix repeat-containing protein [Lachnospiraceae bacterium]|nr:right-handed parallel beta-helix repeat-containing protein [Lachnospiraceae bacterium]